MTKKRKNFVWVVYDPKGRAIGSSMRWDDAIENDSRWPDEDCHLSWRECRRKGYRCKKVRVP